MDKARKKVLAVASGGGHWVQLRRLAPALAGCDITYVTTIPSYRGDVGDARFYVVKDANRWNKPGLIIQGLQLAWILIRERPDIVISTGAAPGYIAVRLGKWLGARAVWIDSIANAEQLSLSGQKIGKHADLWLTQWPHLARPEGPHFCGAVL
jgi:UDP-N-acetylglucosamine:LPS N-acetylglucosamine transferase